MLPSFQKPFFFSFQSVTTGYPPFDNSGLKNQYPSRRGRGGLLHSMLPPPALFDEPDRAGRTVFAIQLRVPAFEAFLA
jgi:hypothetical protein